MNTWAPLWNGIVYSSLWKESDTVRILFITMMALKDSDDIVRYTAYQIGQLANKDEVEVLEALKVLCSPDTKRKEHQEHAGRRIKAVEEGWLVLNGNKYRDMVRLEMKRAKNRRAQAAWRNRQRAKELPGEKEYDKAFGNGATSEQLNKIVTDNLPKHP